MSLRWASHTMCKEPCRLACVEIPPRLAKRFSGPELAWDSAFLILIHAHQPDAWQAPLYITLADACTRVPHGHARGAKCHTLHCQLCYLAKIADTQKDFTHIW